MSVPVARTVEAGQVVNIEPTLYPALRASPAALYVRDERLSRAPAAIGLCVGPTYVATVGRPYLELRRRSHEPSGPRR